MLIHTTFVKIKLVDYDGRYDGWFNQNSDEIRIVETTKDIRAVLRHELTHAYLYYYGFSGAELTEELVCNFVEIYGPQIIEDTNTICGFLGIGG